MVTTRRRAFPLPQMNTNRVGKLQTVAAVLTESDIPTKIGSFETVDREITLTDARILVSSGRSVDGTEGFGTRQALADTLDGGMRSSSGLGGYHAPPHGPNKQNSSARFLHYLRNFCGYPVLLE